MTRFQRVLCLLALLAHPVEGRTFLVKIPKPLTKSFIGINDFSMDHFSHPEFNVGYIDQRAFAKLPASTLEQLEILDPLQWAAGGYDRQTFELRPVDISKLREGYHDYDALTAELKKLSTDYAELTVLDTAGKSVEGRELWYLVIASKSQFKETTPKSFYHANMHGDEVVGRELMIYLARHLLAQYGKDPRITHLLDNAQVFIMPSMNPDGFERGTRENARGKDLNRNFPNRISSPSDTPNGREIEVQRMMGLVSSNHFVYGLNWHGGEICFNLPWGDVSNSKPENKYGDDHFFYPIGREYTSLNQPMHKNHQGNFNHGLTYGYEWYPVYGGINDWFNYYRRAVHSVVELSTVKWPSSSTLAQFWEDNREAMITYLWRGLRGLHLRIADESNVVIRHPVIDLHASNPRRPLRFNDGIVHRLTGDGPQTVTISADGYESITITRTASIFDGSFSPVMLKGSK